MGSVAVVALGRLGIAQPRNLAVVSVKIGVRLLLMAAAAGGHDGLLEAVRVRAADLVRGVAVAADRQFLVRLRDRAGVNAVIELLLDSVVAVAAGVGHV